MVQDKQKAAFLEDPAQRCPYCGSFEIGVTEWECETAAFLEDVCCNSCGARWTEIYQLIDIYDIPFDDY